MSDWADLSTELLPPMLVEFVRLVGLPATMLLVERYGGLRIYIPLRPTPDHQFAQLIGFDKLTALSQVFGSESHFQLPKADRALKAVRNAQIREDFARKSTRQLAVEHRLTERQVTRIVGPTGAGFSPQADLFA